MQNNKETTRLDKWLENLHGFLGAVIAPFLICFKHGTEFFIWAMFILVAGQLGTIINIVNRSLFQGWSFFEALYPDSVTGNFYTYALVLIASILGPLFTRIKNRQKPLFSSISTVFSTILIFTLILCAVFFSFASQQVPSLNYESFKGAELVLDVKQLIFLVLSVIFAWYAYGFSLMVENHELLQLDDESYSQTEDKQVNDMAKKATETKDDGKGVSL